MRWRTERESMAHVVGVADARMLALRFAIAPTRACESSF